MRIAQISDLHFTRLSWNPFRLFSKRILATLNWLFFRKEAFSEEPLEPLPSLFNELGVDLVLVGGDFSTTSLFSEFQAALEFVKKLSQPHIAIPGNHDHYTYRSYRNRHFYRFFMNKRETISHVADFFTLKDHGVEAHQIAPDWWVVALDTALATHPYSSEGFFSEKIEKNLQELLSLLPENCSIIMLNHYPFFVTDHLRHSLKRAGPLESILKRDLRIRLYLHGHTHRNIIADLQSAGFPILLDAGSCGQKKKGSWNLLDLEPDGLNISNYRWEGAWKLSHKEKIAWKRM